MQIVTVRLEGHLRREALEQALAEATKDAAAGRCAMVVDCLQMSDYDLDARHAFVAWQREHKQRFAGVAVLTKKTIWHLVVTAMSLASGQRMMAFEDLAEARVWLTKLN